MATGAGRDAADERSRRPLAGSGPAVNGSGGPGRALPGRARGRRAFHGAKRWQPKASGRGSSSSATALRAASLAKMGRPGPSRPRRGAAGGRFTAKVLTSPVLGATRHLEAKPSGAPKAKPAHVPKVGGPKPLDASSRADEGPVGKGPTVDVGKVVALGGAVERRGAILVEAAADADAFRQQAAKERQAQAEQAATFQVQRKAAGSAPAPASGGAPGSAAAAPGLPETAAEEAKIRAEATSEFGGFSAGAKEWSPKGGGGRGAPVVAKPPPPVPNVAGREPASALSALAALPPKQILGAMGGVAAAATTSVGKKEKTLASSPPTKEIAESPPGPGEPPAKPTINTTVEQITPSGGAEPEAVGGEEHVEAPPLSLTGETDPANVTAQEDVGKAAASTASTSVKSSLTEPRGEQKLIPKVKAETIKPQVPASSGPVDVQTEALQDEAASIVAFQEKPGEINSAVTKGSGEVTKAESECSKKETEEKKKSDEEIKKAEDDSAKKMKEEEDKGRKEVAKERDDASTKHSKLMSDHSTESSAKKAKALEEVSSEKTKGDEEAGRQVKDANDQIGDEKKKGEEDARKAEEEEKRKAEDGSLLGWLERGWDALKDAVATAVSAVWEAVATVVTGIVSTVVSAVSSVLKGVWNTIKGLVSAALEALSKLVADLLEGLKALIDQALALIDAAIKKALDALQALADLLPGVLGDLLDRLVSDLKAAYELLKTALKAAIEAVKSAIQAIVSWAKSAIAGMGMLMALVRDVAADPGAWFSNLGAAVRDGIKNHLWGALKAAVKGWWNGKVTGLINAPGEVLNLLMKGGITMAMVIVMAWEFVKAAIPEIIIQQLMEKVVALLSVGVGTALLLLRALEAAWASVDAIVGAIGKFFGFLQGIKGGGSGAAFGAAVGAGAVAVLEFVSNFLLAGLGAKLQPLKDKLAALAKKVGNKLMGVTKNAGRSKVDGGRAELAEVRDSELGQAVADPNNPVEQKHKDKDRKPDDTDPDAATDPSRSPDPTRSGPADRDGEVTSGMATGTRPDTGDTRNNQRPDRDPDPDTRAAKPTDDGTTEIKVKEDGRIEACPLQRAACTARGHKGNEPDAEAIKRTEAELKAERKQQKKEEKRKEKERKREQKQRSKEEKRERKDKNRAKREDLKQNDGRQLRKDERRRRKDERRRGQEERRQRSDEKRENKRNERDRRIIEENTQRNEPPPAIYSMDSPPTKGAPLDEKFKPIQPLGELTPDQVTKNYGMPPANQAAIQDVCKDLGVTISVRPTTPWASDLLNQGLHAKPEWIKAKTITVADLYLGFSPDDLGKVGFREPKLWPKPPNMPDAQYREITKRYIQRRQEYKDYSAKMEELKEAGKIKIDPETGLIKKVDVNEGGLPTGTETAFTGDHDLFEVYGKNGKRLRGRELAAVVKRLSENGVLHKPHMEWTPKNDAEWRSYYKIIDSHSKGPNPEPLVMFGPDSTPRAVIHGQEFATKP